MHNQCPECNCVWDQEEIEDQYCSACNFPYHEIYEDEDDDTDECATVDQLEAKVSELKIRIGDALRNNDSFERSEYLNELKVVKKEIQKQKKILGIR